jgi:hypothetical protein
VWKPSPKQIGWPTLEQMVVPKHEETDDENPRRLIVMSEKHPGEASWLLGAYDVSQESPFTFTSIPQFNCKPNRGGTDKSFFIVNHWLRPDGPPDPVEASKVNSTKVLTQRLQQCITERNQLPNAVAVDFTSQGDLSKTVNRFNAAIARRSGVTAMVTKTVQQLRDREGITDAEVRELRGLHRLPKISEATARKLLGPLADTLPTPVGLRTFASPCPPGTHAASTAETKAAKKAAERAAEAAATTTTTTVAPETAETAETAEAPEAPEVSGTDGDAPAATTTTAPTPTVFNGCAADHDGG